MPLDLSKIQFPDNMNIREAALFLNIGEQRIRALTRTGDLKVTKNGAGQNVFAKSDLEAFKAQPRKGGGVRKEGAEGKAFVVHISADKLAAVQADLTKHGITLEPRYNYAAQKAYQAKRRAAKSANKDNGSSAPASTPVPAPAQPEPKGVASVLRRK